MLPAQRLFPCSGRKEFSPSVGGTLTFNQTLRRLLPSCRLFYGPTADKFKDTLWKSAEMFADGPGNVVQFATLLETSSTLNGNPGDDASEKSFP